MVSLNSYGRKMLLSCRCYLLRVCTRRDAAGFTIEVDAILIVIPDRNVVDIVDSRNIHVFHGMVIEEVSAIPTASFISLAEIAEAIVDPAIKPDFRTQVAFIKEIDAGTPTPIPWRP